MSRHYAWSSRFSRAVNQRIGIIDAQNHGSEEAIECRMMVRGASGTNYMVGIDEDEFWCSCPDCSTRGSLCKHLIYVLFRALGHEEGFLYQNYFQHHSFATHPETKEKCVDFFQRKERILENLPIGPKQVEQRPIEEEDTCPICYDEFGETADDPVVWCRRKCGKSVHRDCFRMWEAQAVESGKAVSCVYCRSEWL